MRKFIRNKLRAEAEKMGVKPSLYVRNEFNRYQVKKYGVTKRLINQAIGTHKRKTWKMRINAVV